MYALRSAALQETLPLAGVAKPLQEPLQLAGNTPQLAGSTEAVQGAAIDHHTQRPW
jgi:hypothetical protein